MDEYEARRLRQQRESEEKLLKDQQDQTQLVQELTQKFAGKKLLRILSRFNEKLEQDPNGVILEFEDGSKLHFLATSESPYMAFLFGDTPLEPIY